MNQNKRDDFLVALWDALDRKFQGQAGYHSWSENGQIRVELPNGDQFEFTARYNALGDWGPPDQTRFSTEWCECVKPSAANLAYFGHDTCSCGIVKPHYHHLRCGKVCPVG